MVTMFEATFKEWSQAFIFASRIRKRGPSIHDSSELQLNRTDKRVLSFYATLCNGVPSLFMTRGNWEL